jgi:hypothetical protein
MAAEATGAASGGVVKHILLAKFKDEVTPERMDQLIRGYAALISVVPSMKAFHWCILHHPLIKPFSLRFLAR